MSCLAECRACVALCDIVECIQAVALKIITPLYLQETSIHSTISARPPAGARSCILNFIGWCIFRNMCKGGECYSVVSYTSVATVAASEPSSMVPVHVANLDRTTTFRSLACAEHPSFIQSQCFTHSHISLSGTGLGAGTGTGAVHRCLRSLSAPSSCSSHRPDPDARAITCNRDSR